MEATKEEHKDELTELLYHLFTDVSTMIKGEFQGTNKLIELVTKMNLQVSDEYECFGDVASGLRVFVEQLKLKSTNGFDPYLNQINIIEHKVSELETTIFALDRFISDLESKI